MSNSKVPKVISSKALSYFAKLAENLNYTKTARMLGITQPALTQQIKKIERNLGTPLFYSVGKQIHLTDAGNILLKSVNEIYASMIDTIDNIQQSTSSTTGTIRLGILSSIENSVLEDYIIQYHNIQPEIIIETVLLNRRQLWDELENNHIDIALMYLPDDSIRNWRPYRTKRIINEDLILLHNNPKLAEQTTVTLKEATERPWVIYPDNYYLTEFLREQFKNNLIDFPEYMGRFASPYLILKFAQAQQLYTALPQSFIMANQPIVHSQQAHFSPDLSFDLSFVYRKEKDHIPRISTFFQEWDHYLDLKSYTDRLQDAVSF